MLLSMSVLVLFTLDGQPARLIYHPFRGDGLRSGPGLGVSIWRSLFPSIAAMLTLWIELWHIVNLSGRWARFLLVRTPKLE
jgi:hypothetical protein